MPLGVPRGSQAAEEDLVTDAKRGQRGHELFRDT